MTEQVDFYIDENEKTESRREVISPSRKFKLLIRYYGTKAGCWNYSRGTIYNLENNQEVCDIKRNYSSFHHGFITKNNQEWLITGRQYVSQTLVNLENGEEYSPKDSSQFCWAGPFILSPDEKTLIVGGCYWACPYEYKLFDFTKPEDGWPELELEDDVYEEMLDLDDYKQPSFEADKLIFYKTSKIYIPSEKDENSLSPEEIDEIQEEKWNDQNNWKIEENVKLTFLRKENNLILVDKWISDAEKERRAKAELARKAWDEWLIQFKTTDPLYLEFKNLLETLKPPADNYESYGRTYKEWCPEFKETETRWCKRIIKSTDLSVDLEWAVKTGPIKLIIYKNGKRLEDKFYGHSVLDMQNAFNYALSFLK